MGAAGGRGAPRLKAALVWPTVFGCGLYWAMRAGEPEPPPPRGRALPAPTSASAPAMALLSTSSPLSSRSPITICSSLAPQPRSCAALLSERTTPRALKSEGRSSSFFMTKAPVRPPAPVTTT